MTRQQALKRATALWGKSARIEVRPKGARVGAHGEYVNAHSVDRHTTGEPKSGRYRCRQCSSSAIDDANNLIVRDVWHVAGGWQTSYAIGRIMLNMFFEVLAESDSLEGAFAIIDRRRAASATAAAAKAQ